MTGTFRRDMTGTNGTNGTLDLPQSRDNRDRCLRPVPSVPVEVLSRQKSNDLFAETPAAETRARPSRDHGIAPYANRAARRAAWDAWIAQGSPWPPPPGLASASLDAAMRRPGQDRGWKR